MVTKEVIGKCELYLGDCLDVMNALDKEIINLTVTSPPYDNLRNYKGTLQWNEEIWKLVLDKLYRVTKPGGVVVWVVGDATIKGSETGTSFKQALYAKEIGFNLHDTMIYEKDACPFPETNRYYSYFEYMFIFSKNKPKTCNQITDKINKRIGSLVTGTERQTDGSLYKINAVKRGNKRVKEFGVRGNVWKYSPGNGKSSKDKRAYEHPAIFPENLAEDHIISWSNEGDTVFDPLMGSGTTGKMSALNNRQFIGIEKEEAYFKIACERISKSYNERGSNT